MYIDFKDPEKVGYSATKNRAIKQKKSPKLGANKAKKSISLSSLFSKKNSKIEKDETQDISSVTKLLQDDSADIELDSSKKIDYEENILDKIYKTINQQKIEESKEENSIKRQSADSKNSKNNNILNQIMSIETDKKIENIDTEGASEDKVTLITIDEPQESSKKDLTSEIPSLLTPIEGKADKSVKIQEEDSLDTAFIKNEDEQEFEASNLDDTKTTTYSAPAVVPKVGADGFIPFEFKGNAKEYFKIWIVNVALSILTLGIYSAWAKVRTNRYIYGNTYLNNSNFEYNADPKRILLGRVIVVIFYGLFLLFAKYLGMLNIAAAIAGVFILVLPWLIRQGISFKLKSASYRNIPFKFHAKARSFYALAIAGLFLIAALPVAIALSAKFYPHIAPIVGMVGYLVLMFVIFPILYRKFKYLVIDNSSYGNARFKFGATNKDAIKLFFAISVAMFIIGIVISAIMAGANYVASDILHIDLKHIPRDGLVAMGLYIAGSIIYLAFMGFYKGVTDGYLSNFTRNHTKLEEYRLKGEIRPMKLGFISATNAILLILSLGLLYPWTKLRYLRYKIENTYFNCDNYDKFASSGYEDYNTIGEETMDFFDIDIGI